MIGMDELRLLLTVHSGPLSKDGKHPWYGDVSRKAADNLIKRGLLTREDAPEENMFCYYEVTDEAREYVTFIQELLNDEEEMGLLAQLDITKHC